MEEYVRAGNKDWLKHFDFILLDMLSLALALFVCIQLAVQPSLGQLSDGAVPRTAGYADVAGFHGLRDVQHDARRAQARNVSGSA